MIEVQHAGVACAIATATLLSKPEIAPLGLQPIRYNVPLVRRNQPCPCGSGRKFKNCCYQHVD